MTLNRKDLMHRKVMYIFFKNELITKLLALAL
jgi:hypothetical protein